MGSAAEGHVGVADGETSLLERAEILASLDEMLADVRATGQGRLVLVGGEAGVGKTTLLRAFCDGQRKAVRVLWGACEPLRTPRPLGPIVDVAEEIGGALDRLDVAGRKPYEIEAALRPHLQAAKPTVLVLEDLHWADAATLDVIIALASRIGEVRALVLGSYRDDEVDSSDQLRFVLGELVRRPARLKIAPLSPAAVAELAGRAPESDDWAGVDPAELFNSTGGNPFFVTEVLAAGGERIPETVRDAVLARAARLTKPARRLLEAASIIPGRIDLRLLDSLAGDVADRLEECLAAGMLRAGRIDVSFRHELARLAVEEAMLPSRRLALHRAAIEALVALGGDDPDFAALAHHAEAAGDTDGVIRWAPCAAQLSASVGAHREAAAQFARALRFADRLAAAARVELLVARVEECRLSAQFDAAIDAQRQALELQRQAGDRLGEGDSLRSLSRLLFFTGRTDEGEPLAIEAVELLEALPASRELAMAYGNLSQRKMVVEDLAEAVAWGGRAVALAEELHDDETRVYALMNIAAAELAAGRAHGRRNLDRARALANRHGLVDLVGRSHSLFVIAAVRHRDFGLADAYLDTGLKYCTEHGLDTWRTYLVAQRARLELDRGHWAEAGESSASILRDPRSSPVARVWALSTLGRLRARRGDPGAASLLEQARPLAQPTGELMQIVPVAAAIAEAAWLGGDGSTVKSATEASLALALEYRSPWDLGEIAYWRWQAGLRDGLPADGVAEPYRLAIAGESKEAAESWRQLGCPYEASLTLADSDDPAALRQAIDALQQLGAKPAAAIVARRARERGVRGVPRGPRAPARENPAGLTARELEVLALIAEGCRNAEIAQRLVISEKTVDHHVSSILGKLDVRSRSQAATKAVRLGLAQG